MDATASRAPRTVVQKFGGTCLGSGQRLTGVASVVREQLKFSDRVIPVVSALSEVNKEQGTTARLLQAVEHAKSGNTVAVDFELSSLRTYHQRTLAGVCNMSVHYAEPIRLAGIARIDKHIDAAAEACRSLSQSSGSVEHEDAVIAAGERLAAELVVCALHCQGTDADTVDLSESMDHSTSFDERAAAAAVRLALDHCTSRVPVLTGFIGPVAGGMLHTLDRGYTDYTAALASAAAGADRLDVWKDTGGIFEANPQHVPGVRLLPCVTPEEATEMTRFGNEVLHPRTVGVCDELGIPIHVNNMTDPEGPRTVIQRHAPEAEGIKTITALCSQTPVTVVNIHSRGTVGHARFLTKVFAALEARGLRAELVSTSVTDVSVVLAKKTTLQTIRDFERDVSQWGTTTCMENRAVISCIGSRMSHHVGLTADIATALADEGINLEMVSQSCSEINTSVVVDSSRVRDALEELHFRFF